MSRIDDSLEFVPIRIAVLTVSDTRTLDDDKSGDTLVGRVEAAGHRLAALRRQRPPGHRDPARNHQAFGRTGAGGRGRLMRSAR